MTTETAGPPSSLPAFSWADARPEYEALLAEHPDAERVPGWLARWSDLEKRAREAFVVRRRAVDADTADAAAAAELAAFTREVRPEVQRVNQALRRKLLALPFSPAPEHEALWRRFRAEAALHRDENVALEAELAELGQEATRLSGSRTVRFEDEVRPLHEVLSVVTHDRDRTRREAAWRAALDAHLADAPALDDVFTRQQRLRARIARQAGCASYLEYRWRQLGRVDYTPEDAEGLAQAIEHEVVPLLRRAMEVRRGRLGLDTLEPWDLSITPDSAAPLVPYPDASALEEGMADLFARLDPELGAVVADMRDGNLDLDARANKSALHGYCSHFPTTGRPYVMLPFRPSDAGMSHTLHELGHACHHALACAAQPLVWNRPTPLYSASPVNMEFNELASQAMQFLALPHLARERGGPYDADGLERSQVRLLHTVLLALAFIALDDSFMRWACAHEDAGIEEADAQWAELQRRFVPVPHWGHNGRLRKTWQSDVLFTLPLYSIEYAFAWLGALQVWSASLQDEGGAVRRYKAALRLGYTVPLADLYATAGARFGGDRGAVRDVMRVVRDRLAL